MLLVKIQDAWKNQDIIYDYQALSDSWNRKPKWSGIFIYNGIVHKVHE